MDNFFSFLKNSFSSMTNAVSIIQLFIIIFLVGLNINTFFKYETLKKEKDTIVMQEANDLVKEIDFTLSYFGIDLPEFKLDRNDFQCVYKEDLKDEKLFNKIINLKKGEYIFKHYFDEKLKIIYFKIIIKISDKMVLYIKSYKTEENLISAIGEICNIDSVLCLNEMILEYVYK